MSESPQPKGRRPFRRTAGRRTDRTAERPVGHPVDRPADTRADTIAPRPDPPREQTIVLVGLMGVGKTTIGRRLAARLRLGFVDTDREIERAAGLSIPEIFERFGEAHFRDGERRVIRRLLQGRRVVLATGGGAFMDGDTRALILAQARAIWLDADLDILAERVSRRHGTRPLLAGADPRTVLGQLAAVRNPIYALAPVHVRSEPSPHDATVSAILKAMRR